MKKNIFSIEILVMMNPQLANQEANNNVFSITFHIVL